MTEPSETDPNRPRQATEDGAPPPVPSAGPGPGRTASDNADTAEGAEAQETTPEAPNTSEDSITAEPAGNRLADEPAEAAPAPEPSDAGPTSEPPAAAADPEPAPAPAPQPAAGAAPIAPEAAAAANSAESVTSERTTPSSAVVAGAGGGAASRTALAPSSPGSAASVVAALSLPNLLTAARCVSVLIIVVMLLWPWGPQITGALIVFALASATDWLDGRLARAFNLVSPLGRMMDSIADKLLVGATLLCLCAIGVIDGLNVLAAALILMREIAISGLREHLGGRGVVVPASDLAKWKTTFQMVALAALMAAPWAPFETVARVAALLILWAAMGMTLVSGFQYAWATRGEWSEE